MRRRSNVTRARRTRRTLGSIWRRQGPLGRALLAALGLVLFIAALWNAPGLPGPLQEAPVVPLRPSAAAPEGMRAAEVVDVIDGDTIRVLLDGEEWAVRYIGIDTPEVSVEGGAAEPFAAEATEANRRLVEGKSVYLEQDVSQTDRYGRLLRYVHVDDTLVNAELVRQGLARAVAYPPDTHRQAAFEALEAEARDAHRGLWAADEGQD
ncbi:MAG: thermonuclease family protein [Anaerolineae bacterium]